MNDYTRVPRKLKKKWKARESAFLVVAWILCIVGFMYLIGVLAEQFAGSVEWPGR